MRRALALLLTLALGTPARANDCVHDVEAHEWRCTEDGFARLIDESGATDDELADCRKDLKLRTVERDASREHTGELEQAPPPPPPPSDFWSGFGWGGGTALALFVLGLLALR